MSDKDLPKHLTKGGPGDKFLGDGKVDTSEWFQEVDILENQIKNEEIWFCTAPFQLIYTTTKGEWQPCSWAQEDPNGPTVHDTSLEKWFVHNEGMNQLRKEMVTPGSDLSLAKKWCKACMKQEKLYGRSRRQTSLKIQSNDSGLWPRIRDAVERFKKTGKGRIQDRCFEIQIKAFGNKCNLDCYMCMPYDSSIRTNTILKEPALESQDVFDATAKRNAREYFSLKDERMESVIDQIVKIAPYIYNLKLIGGEPLVMKQFYTLLEKIVKSGHAKTMQVKYQTNMSVLNFEKLKITDYIPEFDRFEFTVSLDGVGEYNDYIRRRANWKDIENNIKTVKEYPNVVVNINGTISFLSVLKFYKLIDWFDENKDLFDQINWFNIRNPERLQANVLPEELKQKLIPLYKNFPDIQNILNESNNNIDYKHAIDYLLLMDKRYEGTKWEMHLFDVFPELKEYYNEN